MSALDISEFLNKQNYDEIQSRYFEGFDVVDSVYRKAEDEIILKINTRHIMPYDLVNDFINYLKQYDVEHIHCIFKSEEQDLTLLHFNEYLRAFNKETRLFKDAIAHQSDEGFVLSYIDENAFNNDSRAIDELKLYFYDLGYRKDIEMVMQQHKEAVLEERAPLEEKPAAPKENRPQTNGAPNNSGNKGSFNGNNQYKPRTNNYTDVIIDDMFEPLNNVRFKAEIFKVDERETRTGILIQNLYVKDTTNACIVKLMENRRWTREELKKNKVGKWAIFAGNYRFDPYMNDYLFEPANIEFVENENVLTDDAEVKRVELHTHSKFSEMDGICSPEEIVETAFNMGHKAVALTDHQDCQGFHKAQMKLMDMLKANKEADFKLIYGCEMNMVEPRLNIVYNANDDLMAEQEYVVFDLETTGLSNRHDYIIEFGAVLYYKGLVKERKDFFIKPPVKLSAFTKTLTHIKDEDVENARTFEEAKDEILDFVKGRVLVAHNASFDYGFLNAELKRLGLPKLTNPVIDTLDYAKSLFKSNKRYRLGNIAKQYNVEYDEEVAHRADYDANVLADVFNLMLKDTQKQGVMTLNQLSDFQDKDAFVKNRAYHVIVLAKNEKGIHDLYKLVSVSNTETLAVMGKSSGKSEGAEIPAEPRIFRSEIEKYRENLLIGSACQNGEVFELASTRSEEDLAKAISFYDYIEVQPVGHYSPVYEDRESCTKDRLKEFLWDIINEANKQGKPVVATGDVHYMRKDQKILRDIYIRTQGIGGAHHPLYVYNKEKRAKQVAPDQRFLNTEEMLKEFAWLEDEKLIQDMVINNTNKVADMCEKYMPFNWELHSPKILDAIKKARECRIDEEPFTGLNEVINADEYLERLVWHTAHKLYGENLDETIEKRVKRELDAIIGNGYGVIYYTCHLMVKRSNDDGYVVGSRGSVGSSLAATFSGITEVNPLAPHYICPKCHHLEWRDDVASGYDLPDAVCPKCGEKMRGDGQNIPFETFLGFNGDKTPDIDLNFSGEYQAKAHLFTREIFGPDNVFRAGTISTVADKTAFGYVAGYCEDHEITNMSRAQKERLATGCVDVKRTTGQHAGGIVVLPDDMQIEDVTPIQYPANDINAAWRSTHFEYHDFSENLLKFDILGHDDPTIMRMFERISGLDVKTIPMNDPKVLSLFNSSKALDVINPNYHEETGACGLPEFGTLNTRNTIEETRPKVFSELVQISGLSHGTDVWRGNAQELIRSGIALKDVIGCRDDIMGTLMSYHLEPKDSFSIMEHVRKGKGLTPDEEAMMLEHEVPKWYIESCKKIKYMFPKAHAVAYCIMAVRVAWFKVYHPEYYYAAYFTIRCEQFDLKTMMKDVDAIFERKEELLKKINSRDPATKATKKEADTFDSIEACWEMASRGLKMLNIDLNRSQATEFSVNPDNNKELIPPFTVLEGLGANVAISIVEARKERPFMSKEDLLSRTSLSSTLLKSLEDLGVLDGMDDTNQVSLF